jgi:hypothetical protein
MLRVVALASSLVGEGEAVLGNFEVYISHANNIPNSDTPGFDASDPFVIVKDPTGRECGRTATIWDNPNPQWNERVSCGCIDSGEARIEMWEDDQYGADDFLGWIDSVYTIERWSGTSSFPNGMSLSYSTYWDTSQCTPPPPPSPSPPPPSTTKHNQLTSFSFSHPPPAPLAEKAAEKGVRIMARKSIFIAVAAIFVACSGLAGICKWCKRRAELTAGPSVEMGSTVELSAPPEPEAQAMSMMELNDAARAAAAAEEGKAAEEPPQFASSSSRIKVPGV